MTATAVMPTRTSNAAGIVLAALAAGQFVMVLDSSVMNVSIATVAEDVNTDITGIQTAITMYTLVMASLMVTGGKIGQIIGPKRAFVIGAFIYATGSLITALSTSLPMLLFGWSLLEGIGAALIMPAIVALVASNFPRAERPRAYGLLAAAAATAVAAGPLIGGLCTTYLTWRVVFVGEVVIVAGILVFARKMESSPADKGVRLDLVGTVLSALGLGLIVYGVLRSGTWGFIQPKQGGPEWLGLSPAFWLMVGGGVLLRIFMGWEHRVIAHNGEPLIDPALFKIPILRSGLTAFFFQYTLQAGLFFLVPLYLTVAIGLSAIDTGLRLMPLAIALLLAAIGVPKLFPNVSPRRVSRIGFLLIVGGVLLLIVLLHFSSEPDVVTWPLLFAGLGAGALSSQLGSITVSSVPDSRSGEIGGLQNTATNLGASISTALVGAVLIGALTASFFSGLRDNEQVPQDMVASAEVELAAGVPFLSDVQLEDALEQAGVDDTVAAAIIDENTDARVRGMQIALAVLALLGIAALFTSGGIPIAQPSTDELDDAAAPPG